MEYQLAVLVEHSLKTGTILEMGITIPWNVFNVFNPMIRWG